MDKVTANFCFNFFSEWLKQAEKGVCEVKVPNWSQINKMAERSFPQIAFKYTTDDDDDTTLIECYYKMHEKTETETVIYELEFECPFISRAAKHALREMKSYNPQAVATMVYEKSTFQNAELERYVDRYVRNLMM